MSKDCYPTHSDSYKKQYQNEWYLSLSLEHRLGIYQNLYMENPGRPGPRCTFWYNSLIALKKWKTLLQNNTNEIEVENKYNKSKWGKHQGTKVFNTLPTSDGNTRDYPWTKIKNTVTIHSPDQSAFNGYVGLYRSWSYNTLTDLGQPEESGPGGPFGPGL